MVKRRSTNSGNLLGSWAFLVGFILAIILGFVGELTGAMLVTLAVLGVIVGLLNVADEEVSPFLISGVILVIVAGFGESVFARVELMRNLFQAQLALFVPTTTIVALKNVFNLAKR